MNPAPVRQKLLDFLTPKVADVLVAETHDFTKVKRATIPEYGTPHTESSRYPNHKFCLAVKGDDQGLYYTYLYAAKRENQDDYNWEAVKADMGGRKFDAVQRTYVTPRDEFTPDTPSMGAAMPLVPVDKFTSGYVLGIREQVRAEKEIDSVFVVERLTYVKKVTIDKIGVDEFNGQELYSQTTLYYATEVVTGGLTAAELFDAPSNAYWGLQSNGTQREGEQLSDGWYQIVTSSAIGGVLADGVLTVRSYTTSVNFSWPPVLHASTPIDIKDWELKDGASRYYPSPVFAREGYSGPCKATITETWSPSPFTVDTPETMKPLPISYNCPFFGISIGPTLHGAVAIAADTGSEDPTWGVNTGSSRTFAATTPTDWPATITLDEQRPFRGGYLRQKVVINKPFT